MNPLIIDKIRNAVQERLSPARIAHSLAVGKLAQELCSRYNVPPEKGMLAGIAHDIAREWDESDALSFMRRTRERISRFEKRHPVVLHGRVAAIMLRKEFGIEDQQVLDAIRDHVLGKPGMGLLSQILFVADFLEPKRGFLKEEDRVSLLKLDLETMLVRVTEEIFGFLEAKKKAIAPCSRRMLRRYQRALRRKRV